ncbi:MAG: MBL fold metallo-hydrolase [Acidobacteriota bacterium]|jgi:L-ascorbate metabolism protein UlaG (beta-lactamase superfamily)|nr:MBL fold metallo-hydrolase [Acidobacteriota bacterium]
MIKSTGSLIMIVFFCSALAHGSADVVNTSAGPLEINCLGHASLMLVFNHKVIHVDPYSRMADYASLPDADLILITHQHGDHLDPAAIQAIRQANTRILCSPACVKALPEAEPMRNGDTREACGIHIIAVPAYNIVHQRSEGVLYHPRGEGNGYVLEFGDTRVYIAGDTENTPEMKALKEIDIAFLPINLPYTMTAEMVVDAVKALKPAVLYPYHFAFGTTEIDQLIKSMRDFPETELRVRNKP